MFRFLAPWSQFSVYVWLTVTWEYFVVLNNPVFGYEDRPQSTVRPKKGRQMQPCADYSLLGDLLTDLLIGPREQQDQLDPWNLGQKKGHIYGLG
jgi:hypothetical protein